MARAHVRTVIMNSEEPERLAEFWAAVLGVRMREHDPEAGIIWLEPDEPGGVNIGFQRVAHRASGPSETHIDVAVEGLDAAQASIEERGGALREVHTLEGGFEWRVLMDPDGNPFCIFVE
jgi:predicted enzyme related to lactoylglutathione lyase